MLNNSYLQPVALSAVLALGGVWPVYASTVLTDNLAETSGGSVTISGHSLQAQSFTTDARAYSLDSVQLLLASPDQGTSVSLYSDSGSLPAQLLATLSLSGSYSSELSITTYTADSVLLAANTTYWIVIGNTLGSTDWAYQASDDGSSHAWAEWDGSYWFTYSSYPYQLSVNASALTAVPLPMAWPLFLSGFACLGLCKRRVRRG